MSACNKRCLHGVNLIPYLYSIFSIHMDKEIIGIPNYELEGIMATEIKAKELKKKIDDKEDFILIEVLQSPQ